MASTESSDDESPKASSSETMVENNASPMTPDRGESLAQSSRDLTPEKLQRLPLMSHEGWDENGSINVNGSDINNYSEGDSSEPGTVSENESGDVESDTADDPPLLDDVRLGICDGYGGFFCPHCRRRTQQPYHMCVQALVSDDDEDEELLSDSVNDEIPDEELSLPDEHPHSPDDSDNNDDSDNSANM